jgi:hypothetical protein
MEPKHKYVICILGTYVYPNDIECVRCSNSDIRKFAEEAKEIGIRYVGLCYFTQIKTGVFNTFYLSVVPYINWRIRSALEYTCPVGAPNMWLLESSVENRDAAGFLPKRNTDSWGGWYHPMHVDILPYIRMQLLLCQWYD